MKPISQWLLNLFLQSSCPLCDRPAGELLCRYCQQQLQTCELKNCQEFWTGDLPLFSWSIYQGRVKQAIAALKYKNHPELARPLGTLLGNAWRQSAPLGGIKDKCIVVPIPMHRDKQKQRGFNQAELLAQSFCRISGQELRSHALSRTKETKAQFSLSAQEREQNLSAAFQLGKEGQHLKYPVLLLDDIYTTGATARAAKLVLQQSGIKVVGIIALATTKKN